MLFVTVNQAFFMGLFFLIAGYLTPAAFDRHGAIPFLRERLLRLGFPLLAYGLILGPLTTVLANAPSWTSLPTHLWARLLRLRFDIGPLWFAEALLIFAAAYAAWRARPARPRPGLTPPRAMPGHATVLAAALATGAIAFLLRLAWPIGTTMAGLQIGYFASYTILFATGCAAARSSWLDRITAALAAPWLAAAAVALAAFVAYAHGPGPRSFPGGWSLDAAGYALWEPLFAWGVILGLLWLFARRLNHPSPFLRWIARRAYASYIVHPPLLVAITRLMHPWRAEPLPKMLVAASLACAACLAVSTALLRLPGARRVL